MSFVRREYSYSPIRHYKQEHEFSTAQKIYDLQDSQKKYQELLTENLWLKQQLQKNQGKLSSYISSNQYRTTLHQHKQILKKGQHDVVLWSLMERNRYLQQKIEKLKNQYQKQSKTIHKIENSEKWKSKFKCGPERCYEQKYMQLLRIRSPFF